MQIYEIALPFTRLVANVADPSNNGFTAVGDWFEAGPLVGARAAGELLIRTGNIEVIPAVQFANDRRGAGTIVQLGSTFISSTGTFDASTLTGLESEGSANQWARLGFVTRNTSGTTLATCDVAGRFEIALGDYDSLDVGWSLVIAASTTATFFPRTGWFDALDAQSMRMPFEVAGLVGNMSVSPAYQLANDTLSPDTFVTIAEPLTSDGVGFPPDWTNPDVAGKRWMRAGWSGKLTSGSTLGWANVTGRIQTRPGT